MASDSAAGGGRWGEVIAGAIDLGFAVFFCVCLVMHVRGVDTFKVQADFGVMSLAMEFFTAFYVFFLASALRSQGVEAFMLWMQVVCYLVLAVTIGVLGHWNILFVFLGLTAKTPIQVWLGHPGDFAAACLRRLAQVVYAVLPCGILVAIVQGWTNLPYEVLALGCVSGYFGCMGIYAMWDPWAWVMGQGESGRALS